MKIIKKLDKLSLLLFLIPFLHFIILIKSITINSSIISYISIFLFPIFLIIFKKINNKTITKKKVIPIFFIYMILYLISMGFVDQAVFFSNLFILFLPLIIDYGIESNSSLLKGFLVLLLFIFTLILNNKIVYISIFIISIYFLIKERKRILNNLKKANLKILLGILVFLLGIVIYIPKTITYEQITKNVKEKINIVNNLSIESKIDTYILNGNILNIKAENNKFNESAITEKLFGLKENQSTGIDILDIFYTIGIIGSIAYISCIFIALRKTKLKSPYKFTFILLFLVSCFTTNILTNPFITFWLSLLILISKNDFEKAKKNILLISNMYPSTKYPHYGIFVKNSVDLLLENNYTIDLIVMHKEDKFIRKLFSYIYLCGNSFIKSIVNNYDYIYVHFASHSTVGVIFPSLFLKNTKLVINVHGNDIVADTKKDIRYLWISKISLKHADIVISPSKYFKKILIKDYKIPESKIVVYPSGGVDMNLFKKIDKQIAKEKAKLDSKTKYFGYVSRIEKDKGYDILLNAMHKLKEENKLKDCKFLIIGNGSEEAKLNYLIEKYKLNDFIERQPFATQEELVLIYNSLEALIYPTRRKSESLGLTGLEAMACETLVIGSNKYGPSDYLINGENSLTFNPEDSETLKLEIEKVLNMSSQEKSKITKLARTKSEEYSKENTKETILAVFKKK